VARSRSVFVVELLVTVYNIKILSVAEKCFYGEFMSPATIVVLLNVLRSSYKVPEILWDFNQI
jgi:hypothetical protein